MFAILRKGYLDNSKNVSQADSLKFFWFTIYNRQYVCMQKSVKDKKKKEKIFGIVDNFERNTVKTLLRVIF